MTCCGFFGYFCVFTVLVQLYCGVFRFLYQQIIGPALYGSSIDFKKYGKWARKFRVLCNIHVVLSPK